MRSFILSILFLFAASLAAQAEKVLVSISPQKFLVEKIAGPTVEVQVLVPEDMSPHTYEPTIRQVVSAKDAIIWFCIGESFEITLYNTFKNTLTIVDAREGLPLLHSSGCSCHKGPYDPHIWLSCNLLIAQAKQIEAHLSALFPEKCALYQENLQLLLKEIAETDLYLQKLLGPHKGESILLSHPALGYFCHDYGLIQLAIEVDGKEPSPKQITSLIDCARQANVKIIFTQKQYPLKGALAIQKALNLKIIQINPYAEQVLSNLKFIAEAFSTHD